MEYDCGGIRCVGMRSVEIVEGVRSLDAFIRAGKAAVHLEGGRKEERLVVGAHACFVEHDAVE